ncbi:glycosyltransferase [Thauera sp. ZXT1-4]|uniref:glycosyltransferase n=1 Tax=Thauera sp. ZXT1-4 TaxID=3460294 RepID=UPI004040BAE0
MEPKLSIIICTHNRSALVASLVSELDLQNSNNSIDTEIIVVASGCNDDTVAKLKALQPTIRTSLIVIDEHEPGLSLARNRGLEIARGQFIAFLDDDIRVSTGWADGIIGAFHRHNCDVVGGRIELWWDKIIEPEWMHFYHKRLLGFNEHGESEKSIGSGNVFGGNFAITRKIFEKVGYFSTNLGRRGGERLAGEEADYFLRAQRHNAKFFYTPHATVEHLVNAERATIEYLTRSAYGVGQSRVLLPDQVHKINFPFLFEKLSRLLQETRAEYEKKGGSAVDHSFHKTRRFDLLGECIGVLRYLFGEVEHAPLLTSDVEKLGRFESLVDEAHKKAISVWTAKPQDSAGNKQPAVFSKISIVIPVFNACNHIAQALESILSQGVDSSTFEIICVDDCSTDNSAQIIEQYMRAHNCVRLYRQPRNMKQGAARNVGIQMANGSHILFLDADDKLRDGALTLAIKAAQRGGLSVFQHINFDASTGQELKRSRRHITDNDGFSSALRGTIGWWPFGLIIPRSLLTENSILFQEGVFFEDIEFVVRLAKVAPQVNVYDEVLYTYVVHEASTVNSLDEKKLVDSVEAVRRIFHYIPKTKTQAEHWRRAASNWLIYQFQRIAEQANNQENKNKLFDILFSEISAHNLWSDLDSDTLHKVFRRLIDSGAEGVQEPAIFDLNSVDQLRIANQLFRKKLFGASNFLYRKCSHSSPSISFNIEISNNKAPNRIWRNHSQDNTQDYCSVDYLFIPHNRYHALTCLNLAKTLEAAGLRCAILRTTPPHPDEGSYIWQDRKYYVDLEAFCNGEILPKGVVCLNDWEPHVAARIVRWANRHGIATYGIVEGVNDFYDVDTGLDRKAYQRVTNLLLNGEFDRRYFSNSKQRIEVVGIERLDGLFERSRAITDQPRLRRIIINCNFTYGVLNKEASQWINSVAECCQSIGWDFAISKHHADRTDVGDLPLTTRPLYDELLSSEIFITRFSGAVFEAIIAGAKVIYFNPGVEQIDKFKEPLGAYLYASSKDELVAALRRIEAGWSPQSRQFLELHTGFSYEKNSLPSELSSNRTREILLTDSAFNKKKQEKDIAGGHKYFDPDFKKWTEDLIQKINLK